MTRKTRERKERINKKWRGSLLYHHNERDRHGIDVEEGIVRYSSDLNTAKRREYSHRMGFKVNTLP